MSYPHFLYFPYIFEELIYYLNIPYYKLLTNMWLSDTLLHTFPLRMSSGYAIATDDMWNELSWFWVFNRMLKLANFRGEKLLAYSSNVC